MYVCVYTYNACIYTYTILCLSSFLPLLLSLLSVGFFSFVFRAISILVCRGKAETTAFSCDRFSQLLDFRFDITEPDGCSESFARIEEREIIDDQIGGQGAGWKCMMVWE